MKSNRYGCAAVALMAIVGCAFGAFGCSDDGPDLPAETSGASGDGSTSARTDASGESGPIVQRECRATCTTAADCALGGATLGEDNFACIAGKCEYQGCNSTQECTDDYQKPGYACETVPGGSLKTCFKTCVTAADCATAGDVLADEDNFACTAGKCEYRGCNSTQECRGSAQASNSVCAPQLRSSMTGCVATCTVAADCAAPGVPLSGEKNYACTAGMCQYKGCTSTQECTGAFQRSSFVCE